MSLTHADFSRRGGKAGTGPKKARTTAQARAAALAGWQGAKGKARRTAMRAKTPPPNTTSTVST